VERQESRPAAAIVSVNVGLPREVEWRGGVVRTGIFKSAVRGPVPVRRSNLEGDAQADPSVHGGVHKAVYAYPSEHYAWWRPELGDLPWGAFGENLTTTGLDEAAVRIGDRFRIGSAVLAVTQPRLPCFKLGLRFGRADMERLFQQSGRTGFYLSVVTEGAVAAGDAVHLVAPAADSVTVAEVVRLSGPGRADAGALRRVVALPALPERMREHFRRLLERPEG